MSSGYRFFAFLRAINIGGRRMTNDQLVAPFVRLGLDDVAAYQAAGNVTFRADDPNGLQPERLEAALADAYGLETVAFVRTLGEVSAIVEARPFSAADLAGTDGRVQVSFLRDRPDDDRIAEVVAITPANDLVAFSGRELFWLPTTDISDSRFPIGAVEAILGPMTLRTLGTVSRMVAKFDD